MAMQFKPKTENEIREAQLWPKGEYDFRVTKAERAVGGEQSKNPGVEYIKLTIQIYNDGGMSRFVNGVLHPKMDAQLRHFCEVGKMLDKYEQGTLEAEDCLGVDGRVKIKIREGQGDFPPKNEISDFVPERKAEQKSKPSGTGTSLKHTNPNDGDDVPF